MWLFLSMLLLCEVDENLQRRESLIISNIETVNVYTRKLHNIISNITDQHTTPK